MSIKKLSAEVLAMIAGNLEDSDLTSFRLICRETNYVFVADSSTIWPLLFEKKYDRYPGLVYNQLQNCYQSRGRFLNKGSKYFFDGTSLPEQGCTTKLVEVLVDTYCHVLNGANSGQAPHSKNLDVIEKFAKRYRLFDNYITAPLRANVEQLTTIHSRVHYYRLLTLQVALTHLRFKDEHAFAAFSDIPQCQHVVYVHPRAQPLFNSAFCINMNMLACAVNLFRYHCLSQEFGETYASYKELSLHQRPQAWEKPLQQCKRSLGRNWIGIYSSGPTLNDTNGGGPFRSLPQERADDNIGLFDDGNPFETVVFEPLENLNVLDTRLWPHEFELLLRSLTHPLVSTLDGYLSTTTYTPLEPGCDMAREHFGNRHKYVDPKKVNKGVRQGHFVGHSFEQEWLSLYNGWVTPWMNQVGIPGWRRITMMKFAPPSQPGLDEDENNPRLTRPYSEYARKVDVNTIPDDMSHCMEGVVLPGGRVIVGRWWEPDMDNPEAGLGLPLDDDDEDDDFSGTPTGPFMLWCVDGFNKAIEDN